jgi:hypothetical protein
VTQDFLVRDGDERCCVYAALRVACASAEVGSISMAFWERRRPRLTASGYVLYIVARFESEPESLVVLSRAFAELLVFLAGELQAQFFGDFVG